MKESKDFRQLLDTCFRDAGNDLMSLMIMPVQRVPRLLLLLQVPAIPTSCIHIATEVCVWALNLVSGWEHEPFLPPSQRHSCLPTPFLSSRRRTRAFSQ